MYIIRDRFIIKVSSLHGSSHINLGSLLSRRRGLLFFSAVGPPTRVRWRARLSFRENVISKTFVTHMHDIQIDVPFFFLPRFFRAKLSPVEYTPANLLCAQRVYTQHIMSNLFENEGLTRIVHRGSRTICMSNRFRVTVCFVVNWTRGVFFSFN